MAGVKVAATNAGTPTKELAGRLAQDTSGGNPLEKMKILTLSARFEGKWPHDKTVQIPCGSENVRPKKSTPFKIAFALF